MKIKNSGISLIILVITIILMIILASAIILSLTSNSTIEKAKESKIRNDISIIQEQLSLELANSNLTGSFNADNVIISNDYKDKITITSNGQVVVTTNDPLIKQVTKELLRDKYMEGIIGMYSVKGKTNTSEDKDILKDLSGNGNDIKLINFIWNETSGYSNVNGVTCLRFSKDVMNRGNNIINQGKVKTLLLNFTPKTINSIIFDSRLNSAGNGIALYTNSGSNSSVAWNARTTGAISYVNGIKQATTVAAGAKSEAEMLNTKHVICILAPSENIVAGAYSIGNRISDNDFPGSFDFYSMMTFDKLLSDEEIKIYSNWMIKEEF
ncbi:MAG: hypothetical protein PHR25_04715 [Clostridia bacterium]|nr:hypothetical protein [Clostridia bacterium]MDD4376066.1 hypothetical protein [Clostridia bacterium]